MDLTIVSGAGAGRIVSLPVDGRLQVGRGRECGIVLHDPKVARRHAALEARNGSVVVTDLGSKDGTWVNGQRIADPIVLRGGERLWIGDSVLEVAVDDGSQRGHQEAAPLATSRLRRLPAGAANLVLLRASPGAMVTPRLGAIDHTISSTLKVGAIGLFALAGSVTLLYIGLAVGPAAFVAALLMAVLPVPVYLALALMIDRNEREPRWMLVITFFWGACVATTIAFVLNSLGEAVVQSGLGDRAGEIYGGSISAPVVEEVAKGAVLWIIYRRLRHEFDGVVDGIVYATMVGLGFAANENVLYYSVGALEDGVPGALGTFVARGLISPFAHPLFTAMTGIGLGLATRSTKRSVQILAPALGLGAAVGLHSLWNTSVLLDIPFLVYGVFMVPLFVGMLFFVEYQHWRECHVVGQYLQHDVSSGALYPGELAVLVNLKLRKLALKRARAKGGKHGRRLRRQYHQAATELAFLRDRVTRGVQPWDERTAEQQAHYQAVLQEARLQLGPLLYLPE